MNGGGLTGEGRLVGEEFVRFQQAAVGHEFVPRADKDDVAHDEVVLGNAETAAIAQDQGQDIVAHRTQRLKGAGTASLHRDGNPNRKGNRNHHTNTLGKIGFAARQPVKCVDRKENQRGKEEQERHGFAQGGAQPLAQCGGFGARQAIGAIAFAPTRNRFSAHPLLTVNPKGGQHRFTCLCMNVLHQSSLLFQAIKKRLRFVAQASSFDLNESDPARQSCRT